jgi:hypothetical protein
MMNERGARNNWMRFGARIEVWKTRSGALALVSTIYRRLAGYADLNDAARLSQDPAVASGIGGPQNAAFR